MIEEKYIDLINKEIDGVNSSGESRKLKEYLARNPEAQSLYDELLSISNMLSKVTEIEPPTTLKERILNSIPMSKYEIKESKYIRQGRIPFVKSLLSSPLFSVKFRYAYAFSAGLILGIIILFQFTNGIPKRTALDISDLHGTIVLHGTSGSFETADHAEIAVDRVHGEINITYSTDIVLAELNLKTPHEIEMVLEFDENDIGFNGFTLLDNNVPSRLRIGKSAIRVTNTGDIRYAIIFDDKTPSVTPMNFKIFSSADLVYETVIHTGKKNG